MEHNETQNRTNKAWRQISEEVSLRVRTCLPQEGLFLGEKGLCKERQKTLHFPGQPDPKTRDLGISL